LPAPPAGKGFFMAKARRIRGNCIECIAFVMVGIQLLHDLESARTEESPAMRGLCFVETSWLACFSWEMERKAAAQARSTKRLKSFV
jgi:hypothetical protein